MQVEDRPYADDASPTGESPGYIADSDSMKEDYIDYPYEPEDDHEDLEEEPDEDHNDYPADGGDGDDEPSDDDDTNDEDEEPTEDEDNDEEEEHLAPADSYAVPVVDPVPSAGDTKAFETDEARKTVRLEPHMSASMEARIAEHVTAPTPPPPGHRRARISVRPQTPMTTSTQALIGAFTSGSPSFPLPPTNPAYDQAALGHRTAMIRMRDDILEEDMPPRMRFVFTAPLPGCDVAESSVAAAIPPRGQYDFIDTVEVGQGLIRSPGHDARTIARAADRAEDVGYVRALQASENKMMTSIKEVNLRVSYQARVHIQESEDFYTQLHDAQTDRRDIRLEIDVVRGQRTAYETELHETTILR
nr:hypothetical protein [Tanacetum cinerariifolium]